MHPASFMHLCEDLSPLNKIQRAEKEVKEEWDKYERSREKREVQPCSLRCTFVLEPMIASFNDIKITPDLAETMQTLTRDNTWFSHVSLWFRLSRELEANEHRSHKVVGQLMSSVFGDTRRGYELANSRYIREIDDTLPLQLGTVNLECDTSMTATNFEAMCSAMVVNQSTKKLSMLLEMDPEEPATSQLWWKWLAYALFSKRARACSALESLALVRVGSMSVADVEAFASILASDHPEEVLFGCSRGILNDRDATIKAGALIHNKLNNRGQPPRGSHTLSFQTPIISARIFGDDGSSEWVNVLVPGYGRCYVQRTDLTRHDTFAVSCHGVTDLKIEFERDADSISDGLPNLLAAIGSSLKSLTIDISGIDMDVNAIVRNCPDLEELSLGGGDMMDVRFNFSVYHAKNLPIPDLTLDWDDIVALANTLVIADSPVAKCVRRLRVHLIDQWAAWGVIVADRNNRPAFQAGLRALLDMLAVNKYLEYLDVVVPFGHFIYLEDFRRHHMEPINRSHTLSMDTKIAFLSAITRRSKLPEQKIQKRISTRSAHATRPLSELNQNVISAIFAFAAPRVLRQVYIRDSPQDRWEEPEVVPI
ncbi:hypothetical protein L914_07283 [Phytophthora nicotianae]|uniref:Uncharacterized protein n=1 Tax=Phytophthora nicotianae TaxID=4792 RepID=W2NHL2_PHYNI|nr:hypothetical protein L914_07283 [Phytophthora nicotianae]